MKTTLSYIYKAVTRTTAKNEKLYYSNMVSSNSTQSNSSKIFLYQDYPGENFFVVINSDKRCQAKIVVFNPAGDLLTSKQVEVTKMKQRMSIAAASKNQFNVIAVYVENELVFMQKVRTQRKMKFRI
jgi:hypothetical protein